MQTTFKGGGLGLKMVKTDAKCLMQAKYLCDLIAKLSDMKVNGRPVAKVADDLQHLVNSMGPQYLDDDGNFEGSPRERAAEK